MAAIVLQPPATLWPKQRLREHWRAAWRREQGQKLYTRKALDRLGVVRPSVPLRVTFTRVCSGTQDDDNLRAQLKYFRDGFAAWLHNDPNAKAGAGDGPGDLVTWDYRQLKPGKRGYKALIIDWEECNDGAPTDSHNAVAG